MGERGPLPRPSRLHALSGSRRRQPATLADLPASALGYARCPSWLAGEARSFWRQHAPTLRRQGLLTALDVPLFSGLCVMWQSIRELEAILDRDGYIHVGARGAPRPHPAVRMLGQIQQRFLEVAKAFGLTPAARRRLPAPPPEPDHDPLAAYLGGAS